LSLPYLDGATYWEFKGVETFPFLKNSPYHHSGKQTKYVAMHSTCKYKHKVYTLYTVHVHVHTKE